MANEITVQTSLVINSGNLSWRSPVQTFRDDLTTATPKGPSPGAVTVPTTGVDISLAEFTTPGWMDVYNNSPSYHVDVGIHDGSLFHPLIEVGPGRKATFKLSRNLFEEHTISGTGTTGNINTLHAKAYGGSANVVFNGFEA